MSDSTPASFLISVPWKTLRVFGPDSATWLNAIVTSDVLGVTDGKGAWGSLLTKQGKIQADLQFVGEQHELIVGVSGGDAQATLATLDGYLVMEDAEIEACDLGWVVAVGPEASLALDGRELVRGSLPWGVEGVVAAAASSEVVAQIKNEHADLFIDRQAWAAWLIEHGVPQMGVEYTDKDNLHAASLERRTVDWSKGCYLGQEVVCMQDMRGKVRKRLVRLKGERALPQDAEVSVADEAVGRVVSVAGSWAMASINAPHFEPETAVKVGGVSATVQPLLG